jgi:hypothetical protein
MKRSLKQFSKPIYCYRRCDLPLQIVMGNLLKRPINLQRSVLKRSNSVCDPYLNPAATSSVSGTKVGIATSLG